MLPNLTPDLNNASIGNEPIRSCDFTVTVAARDKQFPHLSAAITAWEFEEVFAHEHETEIEFVTDEDPDEDGDPDDTEYEDDETFLLSLRYNATLNVIQEIQELRELCEDAEFELNVSIVYHTATTKRPVFRHTFAGYPTAQASLRGASSSTDSLSFDLQIDCSKFALTIMV